MEAISRALSLMKVKDDKHKQAALDELKELSRLAELGKAIEWAMGENEMSVVEFDLLGYTPVCIHTVSALIKLYKDNA